MLQSKRATRIKHVTILIQIFYKESKLNPWAYLNVFCKGHALQNYSDGELMFFRFLIHIELSKKQKLNLWDKVVCSITLFAFYHYKIVFIIILYLFCRVNWLHFQIQTNNKNFKKIDPIFNHILINYGQR